MTAKILAFDGSGRKDSMNRAILNHVSDAATAHGGHVTAIDLRSFDLPLYNGDDHAANGFPPALVELKALFKSYDAFLIASPEYNGSFTPLLKNTLDWVSRQMPDEKPLECFRGKVAGLIAVSPGKLGGIRGLYQLNTMMWSLGSLVLPEIVSIGFFKDALDENGQLKNDNEKNAVMNLGRRITDVATALHTRK